MTWVIGHRTCKCKAARSTASAQIRLVRHEKMENYPTATGYSPDRGGGSVSRFVHARSRRCSWPALTGYPSAMVDW
jgi:hypothetical protein